MRKTVITMNIMLCQNLKTRMRRVSGEYAIFDNAGQEHLLPYNTYLSGSQLRYFENLPNAERRMNYVSKLISKC